MNKPMNKTDKASLGITYGDAQAQLFLWLKAIILVPLWALPLLPVSGLLFRSMGEAASQVGYAVVLICCLNYFFADVLKRKIRLDDDYIFFGFRSLPIQEIVSVDV